MTEATPRRADEHRMTHAELAIGRAMQAVEWCGADPRLTEAVCLLEAARRRVSDFVDGVAGTKTVPASA